MKNEKLDEFLRENKVYREYNPKDYIRKVELNREIGYMDNSIKTCLSVKPSAGKIKRYRNKKYESNIRFGIVVCIMNTNEDYLRQMIESVLDQTYDKYRFYIIDRSDRAHAYIANICTDYTDERIIYRKLSDKSTFSWDFLACDYVVFMNELDVLCPQMLAECMEVIEREHSEVIYCDTALFRNKMYNIYNCIRKPDFARINYSTYNYIGDNLVVSKNLFDDSNEYMIMPESGSNYKLFMALCYQAKLVYHIRDILYIENSKKVIKKKIYEREADIEYNPLVSVVIISDDRLSTMTNIINSLREVTAYSNLEIIIMESDDGNEDKTQLYRFYKLISSERIFRFMKVLKLKKKSSIYNYAASHAKGDYLVFLDSKCEIISAMWIEKLLGYIREPQVAIASPKVVNSKKDIIYAGAYHTDKKAAVVYEKDRNKDFSRNVTIACDRCAMVKKDIFYQLGGFDEAYNEDYMIFDLSMKAIAADYEIAYVSDSYVLSDKKLKFDDDDRSVFVKKFKEVLSYDRYREW